MKKTRPKRHLMIRPSVFSDAQKDELRRIHSEHHDPSREGFEDFVLSLEHRIREWQHRNEQLDFAGAKDHLRRILPLIDKLIAEIGKACANEAYGGLVENLVLGGEGKDWRAMLEDLRKNIAYPTIWKAEKKPIDMDRWFFDTEILSVVERHGIPISKYIHGPAVKVLKLCYAAAGTNLSDSAVRKRLILAIDGHRRKIAPSK